MKTRDLVGKWLSEGRATATSDGVALTARPAGALADKLRRAYEWIAREAIVSPYHDIEFGEAVRLGRRGQGGGELALHATSYSSYVLLPLLNLATSQRLLFIGAPGRGKTSMTVLMALLAGGSLAEVKRSVQRGHPQLTIPDLLGSPLPERDAARGRGEGSPHARIRR